MQLVYTSLLLLIRVRFACSEKKICSAIRKPQNTLKMTGDRTNSLVPSKFHFDFSYENSFNSNLRNSETHLNQTVCQVF